jgi:nitrite reductase (NO-forming)
MTNHHRYSPLGGALALLSMAAMPAFAGGSHDHPHENGTTAAPLDIVRAATDLAPPLARSGPETIKVKLDTVEVTGRLADGATFTTGRSTRKSRARSFVRG